MFLYVNYLMKLKAIFFICDLLFIVELKNYQKILFYIILNTHKIFQSSEFEQHESLHHF